MWSLLFATRASIALALCLQVPTLLLAAWRAGRSVDPIDADRDPLRGVDTLWVPFLGLWGALGLDVLTSGQVHRLVATTLPWPVQLATATVLVGWLPAAVLIALCCRSRARQFAVLMGGVIPCVLLAAARLLLYSDVPPWP